MSNHYFFHSAILSFDKFNLAEANMQHGNLWQKSSKYEKKVSVEVKKCLCIEILYVCCNAL